MTDAEKILWFYLQKKQFHNLKFRRQQPIGNYIVDFACLEKNIIIELDGGQHNETHNIEYDAKRDEFLKSHGFKVIRIWNNEIFENIDGVLEYLERAIAASRNDFQNDLEWAVIDDYNELQTIKKQYPDSIMSGSGSTCFLINGEFCNSDNFWVKNNLKSIPTGIEIVFRN